MQFVVPEKTGLPKLCVKAALSAPNQNRYITLKNRPEVLSERPFSSSGKNLVHNCSFKMGKVEQNGNYACNDCCQA